MSPIVPFIKGTLCNTCSKHFEGAGYRFKKFRFCTDEHRLIFEHWYNIPDNGGKLSIHEYYLRHTTHGVA